MTFLGLGSWTQPSLSTVEWRGRSKRYPLIAAAAMISIKDIYIYIYSKLMSHPMDDFLDPTHIQEPGTCSRTNFNSNVFSAQKSVVWFQLAPFLLSLNQAKRPYFLLKLPPNINWQGRWTQNISVISTFKGWIWWSHKKTRQFPRVVNLWKENPFLGLFGICLIWGAFQVGAFVHNLPNLSA